jgi:FlaA1/EpsC-like NDP-sugar epimerase
MDVRLPSFVRSKNGAPTEGAGTTVLLGDVQDYQSLIEVLNVDVAFHLAAISLIPETRAKDVQHVQH